MANKNNYILSGLSPQSSGFSQSNLPRATEGVGTADPLKSLPGTQPVYQNGLYVLSSSGTAPSGGGSAPVGSVGAANTNFAASDPEAAARAAAAAKAAEDARKAGLLRTDTTNIINRVKDIFNSRYGQIDAAAAEQDATLGTRFANESTDVTGQVQTENQKLGVAHAASGTFDSSYRGNNQDTVTKAGESQIRDLGTELEENRAKIGQFVAGKKGELDSNKAGLDAVLSTLGETTDLAELTQLKNTLLAREAELKAGDASISTRAQSLSSLQSIAPSNARAVQLKTTLSKIVAGGADARTKSAIGNQLIAAAGLDPADAEALRQGFQSDISQEKPTV